MVNSHISKKFEVLVIILSLILLIALLFLHNYLIANKDIYNSKVIVKSNRLIDSKYNLSNSYYLLYDDIDVSFCNIDFSLVYTHISSVGILNGRSIENDFEIIVSEKYKDLLNKKINLKINNDKYEFLVVGVYKNNEIINDKYIYTSKDTLDILNSYYTTGEYNYIFIVDGYTDLNNSIDLLRKDGYDIYVLNSETLEEINNYNVINDSIMFFIVLLLSVVFIFIIDMIF